MERQPTSFLRRAGKGRVLAGDREFSWALACGGGTRPSHLLLPALLEHSVLLLAAQDVTMNKYNCQIKSLPGWDLLSLRHTFWAPKSGQGICPRQKSNWSRFTWQISFGAIG